MTETITRPEVAEAKAHSPSDLFAHVIAGLADHRQQASDMVHNNHPGAEPRVIGEAILAALDAPKAHGGATRGGCQAFVAALAPAQKAAADMLDGNPRQRAASQALLAALKGASAIDWGHQKPPAQGVVTLAGPAALTRDPANPVQAALHLHRDGDATSAATVALQFQGLAADELADGPLARQISLGASQTNLDVPFALAPGRDLTARQVTVTITAVQGATVGKPAAVTITLKAVAPPPPPPPPTLTLTGPGDVTPSLTAETDVAATVGVSPAQAADLALGYAITGQQDGDLLSPASGDVTVPAGRASASVQVRVAALKLLADRPLTVALSGDGPLPAPVVFSLKKNYAPPPPPPPPPPPSSRPGIPAPVDLSGRNRIQVQPKDFASLNKIATPGCWLVTGPEVPDLAHIGGFNVPDCVIGPDTVGGTVMKGAGVVHAAGTILHGVAIVGQLALQAPGVRLSKSDIAGNLTFQGKDQVADRTVIHDFRNMGVHAIVTTERPLMALCHVHTMTGADPNSATHIMWGVSKETSAAPIAPVMISCLVERGTGIHTELVEGKTHNVLVIDVTAIGGRVMRRHGTGFFRLEGVWVEDGEGIQLADQGCVALRCKTVGGKLNVMAGNCSGDELRKGTSATLYAIAQDAHVVEHDGDVLVGFAYNSWPAATLRMPVGTKLTRCRQPALRPGATVDTSADWTDPLPPPARKLTAAQVGPRGTGA